MNRLRKIVENIHKRGQRMGFPIFMKKKDIDEGMAAIMEWHNNELDRVLAERSRRERLQDFTKSKDAEDKNSL